MPSWGWILIAVAVVALIVAFAVRRMMTRRRSQQLQERFGPEYEHAVEQSSTPTRPTTGGRMPTQWRPPSLVRTSGKGRSVTTWTPRLVRIGSTWASEMSLRE